MVCISLPRLWTFFSTDILRSRLSIEESACNSTAVFRGLFSGCMNVGVKGSWLSRSSCRSFRRLLRRSIVSIRFLLHHENIFGPCFRMRYGNMTMTSKNDSTPTTTKPMSFRYSSALRYLYTVFGLPENQNIAEIVSKKSRSIVVP